MQKKSLLVLLALSFVFTAACSTASKYAPDDVTKAQQQANADMAAAEAKKDAAHDHANERMSVYTKLANGTVTVDTSASKLEFYGAKQSGGHDGGFTNYAGEMSFDENGTIGKVKFEVDINSIYTDAEQLTEHLKSADFFEVETYPRATFESTEVVVATTDLNKYTVTGDMTIKGETKSITFPVEIAIVDGKMHTMAEFEINRFDYGIVYEGKADDLIKKEVLLKLNFVADVPALN